MGCVEHLYPSRGCNSVERVLSIGTPVLSRDQVRITDCRYCSFQRVLIDNQTFKYSVHLKRVVSTVDTGTIPYCTKGRIRIADRSQAPKG